jgi:uncharacterized cupredoxin-like copper-binding protein
MRRLFLLIAALGLVAAACGSAAPLPPRFIAISMTDAMRFVPDTITVAVGEAVVLQVANDGQIVHEFMVGNAAAQNAHAALMAAMPSASTTGHSHDAAEHDDGGVSVAPGSGAVREYTFTTAGTLFIGCHEPGHYDAGMVATIVVR